jgi:NADH:ubiquinone oxidoreductase subunit 5 (subunit L)/multisubunit Na+/H+ antiporter MnhA subunit
MGLGLIAAMLGSALTLASFVKVLHAAFLRKASPEIEAKKPSEVGFTMWFPMVLLAGACVLFGIFANRLPLRLFVLPAVPVPVAFSGTWWAGPATVMLVAGIAAGFIIYLAGTVRKAKECDTYIGGELINKTYISDEEAGEIRDVEVTGIDFYATIREMTPFRQMYALADVKLFDIYEVGTHITFGVSKIFSLFHSGVLRTYVTWYVIGLVVLLFALKQGF